MMLGDNQLCEGVGMSEPNLYPEPVDVLRSKRDFLRERLASEREELSRYRKLRLEQGEALDGLIARCEEDANMTSSLVKDYTAALRKVGR